MAILNDKKEWKDSAGNFIPRSYVKQLDRDKDALVVKLVKLATEQNERLRKLKELANDMIDDYLDKSAREAGLKLNPGGNYTLTGFSGDIQVERKRIAFIEFDEKLQFAKKKIDDCLHRWSEGANKNLTVLVGDAFKVDKKGQVDKIRLLGLRRLNIKDVEWNEAMELITEAIKVVARREYLAFRIKNDRGEWETIHLDIARV